MHQPEINWSFILDAAQWLLMVLLALITWTRKPGEEAGAAVESMSRRLAVIEERISHMPTDEELTELAGSVKVVVAQVQGMRDSQTSMSSQLNRIENYLLNRT